MALNFRTESDGIRAGMWLKAIGGNVPAREWCRDHGVGLIKAGGESINSAGGFLVPTEMSQGIISNREIGGIFRQHAHVVSMGSDTLSAPVRGASLTAYWTGEAVVIPESQPALGNVSLVAKKLAALVTASLETEEDSPIELAAWLAEEMSAAFLSAEDSAGFNGDGTSTFGGHVGINTLLVDGTHNAGKVAAAGGHNSLLTIDAVDLGNLVAAAPSYALQNAAFYCGTRAMGSTFTRLAAAGGGLHVVSNEICFSGFPIRTTPALLNTTATATGSVMMLFGDLSRSTTLGSRRDFTMARCMGSDIDDMILFRGTERVSIVSHSLGDNDNAGPVVGLVGTA